MDTNKIIEVKNLTKKFGEFVAVDDISFFFLFGNHFFKKI